MRRQNKSFLCTFDEWKVDMVLDSYPLKGGSRPSAGTVATAKWNMFSSYFMMTSSNGNIFRVTGPLWGEFSEFTNEFPAQRPVTRSFVVSLTCALNKRLSEQSWGWWFETPSHPLWRHNNVLWPSVISFNVFFWYVHWSIDIAGIHASIR